MRINPILFLCVALISCGQSDDNVFDAPVHEAKAQKECAVKGIRLHFGEDNIGNISGIFIYESTLLLKGVVPESPSLIHIFSTEDNSSVGHYVSKGRAEYELLTPIIKGCIQKEDRPIYLFDLNLCAAYSFDIKKSLSNRMTELSLLRTLPPQTLDSYPWNDGHLVFVPRKDDYVCEILSGDGEGLKEISLFPNVSGTDHFDALSSACAVNQTRKSLVMAMCMLPQVNVLDVSTGEKYTVAVSKDYKNWRKILNCGNSDRRVYYTAITQSSKNILALYSDCSFEEWVKGVISPHLHIFDWDGNFLFDVTVSENLKVITFDEVTHILYGVDLNDNVYKYNLSNLLCDVK